jgi:alpha-L-fucosidase
MIMRIHFAKTLATASLVVAAGALHAAAPLDTIEASDETAAGSARVKAITPGPFAPDWASLADYQAPDWFRDAKFGIFMHWGLPAVPDETRPFSTGHYARGLYYQDGIGAVPHCKLINAWHVQTYGHPSEFGYKDFIPMWKAERFDADALTAFYKSIGARYIVPVAVHHDNFDVYDSTHHRWNAARMGPKRDILGEWKKAAEKHGLRFGASSHLDRAPSFLEASHGSDKTGPKAGVPYDGADPRYADFYLKGVSAEDFQYNWYQRTLELVERYEVDLLYFDGGLPFGEYGLSVAAELYNRSIARHGRNEAVLNLKRGPDARAYVHDIERGQSDRLQPLAWQTDTTLISGWFYHKADLEMTTPVVIANLADIVSKNGNLLLNVGLKPDGTLPDNQRECLEGVGRWLEVNGEAIYETRPWVVYGEGPTEVKSGHFNEPRSPYTAQDVRFTTRGDVLYAIVLGWPGDGAEILVSSIVAERLERTIGRVELLASGASLPFRLTAEGLRVRFPERQVGEHAFVLRLSPLR